MSLLQNLGHWWQRRLARRRLSRAIESISVLRLGPTDTIVVGSRCKLSMSARDHLVQAFSIAFPHHPCVILEDEIHIAGLVREVPSILDILTPSQN